MNLKNIGFAGLLVVGTIACNHSDTQTKRTFTDHWQQFLSDQIDSLTHQKPGMNKNVFIDGESTETVQSDTINWAEELEILVSIDVTKELAKHEYFKSENAQNKVDGMIYTEYTCKDTNAYLQEFTVVKNGGKVNLIQWKTKERSFMMDRDRTMGYVPMKGFQMQVHENSLWSKPKTIEISESIQSKNSLEQ